MAIDTARTYNETLIKAVVRELWDHLVDDSPLDPEQFEPRVDDESRWYTTREDGEVLGVYWLRKLNHITWEIHTNVRPQFWGSGKTLKHARGLLQFAFEDTGAQRFVALIPESTPHVLRYAESLGFQREGRMRRSHLKNGVVGDQIHLGISKEHIK